MDEPVDSAEMSTIWDVEAMAQKNIDLLSRKIRSWFLFIFLIMSSVVK